MKAKGGRGIRRCAVLLAFGRPGVVIGLVGVLALGGAGAQFTFSPSFQNYQSFSQRTYGFVAATEQPKFAQVIEQQTQTQQTQKAQAAPVYRYALARSDLGFSGQPTQQKNCAALASKPAEQRQMADLCLRLFREIEGQPEFRRHNLASALAVLIGVSLQVSRGSDLDDARTDRLIRGLNDLLVGGGAMKADPGELQVSYESALMTGGLIAALAQQGEEGGDAALTAAARGLADGVLQSFGVKP